MEKELKAVGQRIKNTRRTQNISQESLADMAGIDRSHMGFIERGKKDIRISTLIKIAQALGVTPGDLLD